MIGRRTTEAPRVQRAPEASATDGPGGLRDGQEIQHLKGTRPPGWRSIEELVGEVATTYRAVIVGDDGAYVLGSYPTADQAEATRAAVAFVPTARLRGHRVFLEVTYTARLLEVSASG